jgi:hypothetical protein
LRQLFYRLNIAGIQPGAVFAGRAGCPDKWLAATLASHFFCVRRLFAQLSLAPLTEIPGHYQQ